MKSDDHIRKYLECFWGESAEDCYLIDGYPQAFVGVCLDPHQSMLPRTVYDTEKIVAALRRSPMSDDDAREFFDYNIVRGAEYLGERAPLFFVSAPKVNLPMAKKKKKGGCK